jgi:hypothetical protein
MLGDSSNHLPSCQISTNVRGIKEIPSPRIFLHGVSGISNSSQSELLNGDQWETARMLCRVFPRFARNPAPTGTPANTSADLDSQLDAISSCRSNQRSGIKLSLLETPILSHRTITMSKKSKAEAVAELPNGPYQLSTIPQKCTGVEATNSERIRGPAQRERFMWPWTFVFIRWAPIPKIIGL